MAHPKNAVRFSARPISRPGAYDNSGFGTQDAEILFDTLEDSAAHRLNFALREAFKSGNNRHRARFARRVFARSGPSSDLNERLRTQIMNLIMYTV
jgi:hypothetical protein